LRHILKSRIFCIVLDIARYDKGVTEATDLLEEIFQYIQTKFDPNMDDDIVELDIDIKVDGTMITLFAYHDDKVVLEKRLIFVINKYDLVNDKEILKEYTDQLKNQLVLFFKQKSTTTKRTAKTIQRIFLCFDQNNFIESIINYLVKAIQSVSVKSSALLSPIDFKNSF